MTLEQLFDYDLWANRQWLALLQRQGMPEPDRGIFQHILAAQEIWLRRCQGHSPSAMPQPELDEANLEAMNRDWKKVLAESTHDPVVEFSRTTGEKYALTLVQIARHVINHGTYHRGELRGLRRAAGEADFPETDLAGFYFDAGFAP